MWTVAAGLTDWAACVTSTSKRSPHPLILCPGVGLSACPSHPPRAPAQAVPQLPGDSGEGHPGPQSAVASREDGCSHPHGYRILPVGTHQQQHPVSQAGKDSSDLPGVIPQICTGNPRPHLGKQASRTALWDLDDLGCP
jgi:hypothetical protein